MFRPIANTGLMVPEEIKIPTISGSIALKAQRVDVNTSGRRKTSLLQASGR